VPINVPVANVGAARPDPGTPIHLENSDMSQSDVTTRPEQGSDQQSVALPEDRTGLPSYRRRTVTSVVTTLVLAVFATLLGPLGMLQSAQAVDGDPRFRVGMTGSEYVAFINHFRDQINDGEGTSVPGAGTRVQHTNPNLNEQRRYLQVDVQMAHSNEFVRLQFDRRNLYLLGWWSYHNVYYYLGDRPNHTPSYGERSRPDGGRQRDADRWERVASENYSQLEQFAGERRVNMNIGHDTINAAAMFLYSRNPNYDNRDRALGALRMIQFISEAARFRPIRDDIALTIGRSDSHFSMPTQFVAQENQWGTLSNRYNWLLKQRPGFRDPHPLTGYRRDGFGFAVAIILHTAADYANWVLSVSKGRQK
jgi:hypothetical protein